MKSNVRYKMKWQKVMKCRVYVYVCLTARLYVHLVVPTGRAAVSAAVQTAAPQGSASPSYSHELI